MNHIPERQNQPKQLQRLAAQRQLYSNAKRLFAAQIVLSAPLAIVWSIIVVVNPPAKGIAAFWGLCVALIDLLWLSPWQKRLREKAARIQECFDCDVLEMPSNDLKTGDRPDPELVKEYSTKYAKIEPDFQSLKDWYPTAVGQIDLDVARIICQRSNCWWDANQRRRYAAWIIVTVSVSAAAAIAIGILGHFSMDVFFLAVVAPLAPTLILATRHFTEQREAAARLDRLKAHAERLWELAFAHPRNCELVVKSRSLQDEIFENRKRSPLVFDWIFRRLRKDYEIQMNHSAGEFVAEAIQRLNASRRDK